MSSLIGMRWYVSEYVRRQFVFPSTPPSTSSSPLYTPSESYPSPTPPPHHSHPNHNPYHKVLTLFATFSETAPLPSIFPVFLFTVVPVIWTRLYRVFCGRDFGETGHVLQVVAIRRQSCLGTWEGQSWGRGGVSAVVLLF